MRLVKASTQYKSSRAARFDFTLLWKDWLWLTSLLMLLTSCWGS
jgi:hypothetical protein